MHVKPSLLWGIRQFLRRKSSVLPVQDRHSVQKIFAKLRVQKVQDRKPRRHARCVTHLLLSRAHAGQHAQQASTSHTTARSQPVNLGPCDKSVTLLHAVLVPSLPATNTHTQGSHYILYFAYHGTHSRPVSLRPTLIHARLEETPHTRHRLTYMSRLLPVVMIYEVLFTGQAY